MKKLIYILLIIFSIPCYAQQLWYEDSNVRKAGGYPADFSKMWEQPNLWKETLDRIDVYMIRGNALNNIINKYGEDFVTKKMIPLLIANDIKLAIDNPPANFQYQYNLIKNAGLEISYVGLQSILSKPKPTSPRYNPELQNRITQAKNTINNFRKFAPNIKYGIIDARPTKGWSYEAAYRAIKQQVNIDFILLDCPYSFPELGKNITFNEIIRIQNLVQSLGMEFGLSITDNKGGLSSESLFRTNVLKYGNKVKNNGLDFIALMHWYNYPKLSLPETGNYPLTRVGKDLFTIFKPTPILVDELIYNLKFIKFGNTYRLEDQFGTDRTQEIKDKL